MIKVCERHGEYESQEFGFSFSAIRMWSPCPRCAEDESMMYDKKMARIHDTSIRMEYQERGIESEYMNKTLKSYIPENDSEQKALDAARRLANGDIQKLVLLGSNGVGKTLLASALVLQLGGIRTTMYRLGSRIRASYADKSETELEILDSFLEYPLIVIDELGLTKASEAEQHWLSYLIDRAHTGGIKLVLISNKKRASSLPPEMRQDSFERCLPNDVMSRLRQRTEVVEIKGRDRRGLTA